MSASTVTTLVDRAMASKHWIAGAIKHPGGLHRALGIKEGQKIPPGRIAAAAKKGGRLGRMARLAQTLKGLRHKGGRTLHERAHEKLYGKR